MNREDNVALEIGDAVRERDGHLCCVTGWHDDVKPTYIVAPSILEDGDLQLGVYADTRISHLT